MESQIATGAHGRVGFDVPEQGLHLRHIGVTDDGAAVMGGTLDTSLGPISIQAVGNDLRGWHGGADPSPPMAEDHHGAEIVAAVHEQFVALEPCDGAYAGTIRIANRTLAVVDRDGVITISET